MNRTIESIFKARNDFDAHAKLMKIIENEKGLLIDRRIAKADRDFNDDITVRAHVKPKENVDDKPKVTVTAPKPKAKKIKPLSDQSILDLFEEYPLMMEEPIEEFDPFLENKLK